MPKKKPDTYTKEELKRASKIAEKTRIIPSGQFILSMLMANLAIENYKPNNTKGKSYEKVSTKKA